MQHYTQLSSLAGCPKPRRIVIHEAQNATEHPLVVRLNCSLQLRVFRFGLLQDGDVGVGVFPECEEILICPHGFWWFSEWMLSLNHVDVTPVWLSSWLKRAKARSRT